MLKNISLFILYIFFNFSSMVFFSNNNLLFSIFYSSFFCSMNSFSIYWFSIWSFAPRRGRTRKTNMKFSSEITSKITSKISSKFNSTKKVIIIVKFKKIWERIFTSEKIFKYIICIKSSKIKMNSSVIILVSFIFIR